MAAQLAAATRAEDAHILLWRNGGEVEGSHVVGNRLGYLRLASVLLRASIAPYKKNSADILELDGEKILEDYSYFSFYWFERREDGWSKPEVETPPKRRWYEPFCSLGCAALGLAFAAIFGTGLIVILKSIFG